MLQRERDELEGHYTQVDPEAPEQRQVHGQYTEHGGIGPDADVSGTYVGADHDGEEPLVRSTHQRGGNYPKADHNRQGRARGRANSGSPDPTEQ